MPRFTSFVVTQSSVARGMSLARWPECRLLPPGCLAVRARCTGGHDPQPWRTGHWTSDARGGETPPRMAARPLRLPNKPYSRCWKGMLTPPPSPAEIEIVPDPYGRPTVSLPPQCAVHQPPFYRPQPGHRRRFGRPRSGTLVGIDLESLSHRRQDYESIAFRSPGARPAGRSAAGFAPAVGLAYVVRQGSRGQGAGAWLERWTAGIPYHPRRHRIRGIVEVELRDGALVRLPQLCRQDPSPFTRRANPILCFLR